MNSFYSFIFIGDTHGFIKDFLKQKEIIEKINPEFVLVESLQNISLDSPAKYKRVIEKEKISKEIPFKDLKKLILLCSEKKISLIGMDLNHFGFNKILQNKIRKKEPFTDEEELELKKILEKRSHHHLKIIRKYKNKTKKPIIVIIGSWHLQENSPLMKSLDNYKVILPCDKKGKLLIEPPIKKEEMNYCERVKCKKN